MGATSGGAPRIAVIGAGWWSTEFHLPSLHEYEGAELVALVDTDQERLTRVSHKYPYALPLTTVEELVNEQIADGVVIATPSATHFGIASACLKAGLHVMLEKPMTTVSSDAWELERLSRERGVHLTIGYTFQHTNAAAVLWEEVRAGAIGEVIAVSGLFASMVEAYYRGTPEQYRHVFQWAINGPTDGTYSNPELAGGGQAATQLSHAFGMVTHVCGKAIKEIYAKMDYRDLSVDLVDAMTYEFWNGGIGTMCSTGNMRPFEPHQQEFRYYGSHGYALQDLVSGTAFIQRRDGTVVKVDKGDVGDPYPAYATSRHLADLISGRATRNRAPAIEGAWATDAIDASYRSVLSGQPESATHASRSEGALA